MEGIRVDKDEATRDYGDDVTSELKKQAERQRVTISLTPDQLEQVIGQLGKIDPSRPALIDLVVEEKPIGDLRVAGYWYAGDTCCV
ncbi:MAG: hypothetical protein M3217_12090 [Actinomycetota bacterium]|nr:hypothetical protein [Actinomycetota bacterium]